LSLTHIKSNIEDTDQNILLLKLEKRSLQEQIIRQLDLRADDLGLSDDEKRAQLSKLHLSPFGGHDEVSQGLIGSLGVSQGIVNAQNQDIS